MISCERIVGPQTEPVSLDTAKLHLRVNGDAEDALIVALITAAREYVENYTQRALFTQTWMATLDTFPYQQARFTSWFNTFAIFLPWPVVRSIDLIRYQDTAGNWNILSPAAYTLASSPGLTRLTPTNGTSWPYPGVLIPGTVQITYTTASYGDGVVINDCPVSIQQAMLLLIGHWYAQREGVSNTLMTTVPLAVEALLGPYRVLTV